MKYVIAAYAIAVGSILAYVAYLRVERQKLSGAGGGSLRPALRAPAAAAAFIATAGVVASLVASTHPDQPLGLEDLLVSAAAGGGVAAGLAWLMRGGMSA